MGMMYRAVFEDIAVSAAQDLFEILAPADAVVKVHEVYVGQSSDYGDASAEGLAISIVRGEGSVTSGSGGGSVTPAPQEKGFAAAGSVVERNNTTKMVVGTGTLVVVHNDAFNIQSGWQYIPTPEGRPVISPGDRLTVELVGAPADAITMSATVVFEEIGG